jgi:hypothetical protein
MGKSRKHIIALLYFVTRLAGSPELTVFNRKIQATHPETVTRSVYFATGNHEIAVVVSRKGIVAGAKIAVINCEVVAKPGVQAIVSSSD